ncbi:MAG TPA: MBG domain-containing protein, partial [Opitutaceae bacterium]|nr:MBG domain-containing protein [Opitutaceae bacterium]
FPFGVAFDASGNLFVASLNGNSISKITPTGTVSVVVSSGLYMPTGLAFDAAGNLYVGNAGDSTIKKIVLIAPPAITSTLSASGVVGTPFNYQISASNSPTSFNASGLAVGLSVSTVSGAITGTPTAVGTTTVSISATNSGGTGNTSNLVITITKGTPTISWSAPAAITYGTPLSVTQLNAVSGTPGTFTYSPALGTVLSAGSQTLNTSFTPIDTTDYNIVLTSRPLTVNPAAATVVLSSLNQTYTGSPLSPGVTTSPGGLSVAVTYNGSSTAPSAVGSYATVATITDPNYTGGSSGTFVIAAPSPSSQSITFGALPNQIYGVAPFTLNATASSGLPVSFSVLGGPAIVSGNTLSITGVGTVTVQTSQSGNGSFAAAPNVSQSFTVVQASGNVTVTNLSHTYDGSPKSVSVTTTPGGLATSVTYNGSPTAPSAVGSYAVVATITNPNYTGGSSGTLVIAAPSPSSQSITFGALPNQIYGVAPFALSATASSGLPVSFSVLGGPATVSGNTLSITGVGTVTIQTSQSGNGGFAAAPNVFQSFAVVQASGNVTVANLSQTYDSSPKSVSVTTTPGGLATSVTYNGSPMAPSAAGSYAVIATITDPNYFGSTTGILAINVAQRLTSLSARTQVGTGDDVLIGGFALQGTKPKTVLIRASGPALANYGIQNFLAKPALQLYQGATVVASNTAWGNAANATDIAQATASAGAFSFAVGSTDSAILATLDPGAYTAIVSGADGGTGVSLIEVYDTSNVSSRLTALSARCPIGQQNQVLIVGLNITGSAPEKVLIRASGPTLSSFGVANALADPQLQILQGASLVAQNDNWNNDPQVQTAGLQVGAFPLQPSSKDAATVVTLSPGIYTIVVSGVAGTTGVALVEVYEVP